MEKKIQTAKRREYYQQNKTKLCKKLLYEYCEHSIARIQKTHAAQINALVLKYPYQKCCIKYFKKLCSRYHIRQTSILQGDCEDACMMAYYYGICQCCLKTDYEQYILPYIYKVMRIYFCAALTLGSESAIICKQHHLKPVSASNCRV